MLKTLRIDDPLQGDDVFIRKMEDLVVLVDQHDGECKESYEANDRHYQIVADFIRKGHKKVKGYNFMIVDDTDEHMYHKLIEDYNKTLERDVERKTREIIQINDVFGKNVSPQIRDHLLKGNIGAANRMEYTVIGDAVNTAIAGQSYIEKSFPR